MGRVGDQDDEGWGKSASVGFFQASQHRKRCADFAEVQYEDGGAVSHHVAFPLRFHCSLKAIVEGTEVPEDQALSEDETNKGLVLQRSFRDRSFTRRRESKESSIEQDRRLRQEAEARLASKFGGEVVFEGISSTPAKEESSDSDSDSDSDSVAKEEVAKEEVATEESSDSDDRDYDLGQSKKEQMKQKWKQNEYVKLAGEIGSDMMNMMKKSNLTRKTKEGVKKLEDKVKQERDKHAHEEKKDVKEVAKSSWGWLSSKTKKVFTAAVNGTKEYVKDIKEEFGPNSKKKEDSEYDSEYSYYSDYSDYSEEEEKKDVKKVEEVKKEEEDPNEP